MRFTDASFGNNRDMKSQLGYYILMVVNNNIFNIIHYRNNKCKHISRSVMVAEIQALVLGFDFSFLFKNLVEEILDRKLNLEEIIYSKTVFNVLS